jgi:hypothetical protein
MAKSGLEFRPWVHKAADTVENAKIPSMPVGISDMHPVNTPLSLIPGKLPLPPSTPSANVDIEESWIQNLLGGKLLNGCCGRPESLNYVIDPVDPADPTRDQLELARKKLELEVELEKLSSRTPEASVRNSPPDNLCTPAGPPPASWEPHTPPTTIRKMGDFGELQTPPSSTRPSRASSRANIAPLPTLLEVSQAIEEASSPAQ